MSFLLLPFSNKSLPSVSGHGGGGGICVNADGTLFASAHFTSHAVYIYGMDDKGERTGPAVVVGTVGFPGDASPLLFYPEHLCFVRRGGIDTLLISNRHGGRIVEVTTSGTYMRDIPILSNHWNQPPYLSFCEKTDLISVAAWAGSPVCCVHYESGAVAWTLCESICASKAVLTPDGEYILVADDPKGHINKYSVSTRKVVASIVSRVHYPKEILMDYEGNIIVIPGNMLGVCIFSPSGKETRHMFSGSGVYSMSFSPLLNGLIVKNVVCGDVFLLPYAHNWRDSSRCAWLSACTL